MCICSRDDDSSLLERLRLPRVSHNIAMNTPVAIFRCKHNLMYVWICVYIYIHTCIRISRSRQWRNFWGRIFEFLCSGLFSSLARTLTHTHTHTHTCTHTHTHTHTQVHRVRLSLNILSFLLLFLIDFSVPLSFFLSLSEALSLAHTLTLFSHVWIYAVTVWRNRVAKIGRFRKASDVFEKEPCFALLPKTFRKKICIFT